jgi:hypothetical protein
MALAGSSGQRQQDVFLHAQGGIELRDLEGAGDAPFGDKTWRKASAIAAHNQDAAAVGLDVAGDQIQERRLAGPVRPYDANDLPVAHGDVDRIGSLDHVERAGQVDGLQDRFAVSHSQLLSIHG